MYPFFEFLCKCKSNHPVMNKIKKISVPKIVSMENSWYELADPKHFWMRWRFKIIHKNIHKFINSQTKILEIGCGNGAVMKQFHDSIHCVIDGCDINADAFKEMHSIPGNVFLYDIYDQNPDLIKKYDIVLLLDVIEHLDNDQEFLEKALMHLKQGGLIVMSVPAKKFLYSNYDLLIGHKRRYNIKSINQLFRTLNVDVIQVKYWGFLLLPLLIVRKLYLDLFHIRNNVRAGFKPPNQFINRILLFGMKLETAWFSTVIVGTSIFAIGRKKND